MGNGSENPASRPRRIPPSDAAADAVERIVSRRQIQLESGDIVIYRERVPNLRTNADSASAVWRYRVRPFPSAGDAPTFNSFQHAASEAEQMATARQARVMYVEDDVPSLLVDYRRTGR